MKLTKQTLSKLIKEVYEGMIGEMARISSYYSIGDLSKLDELRPLIGHPGKTDRILAFLKDNPNSTMLDIARNLYPNSPEHKTQMISPPFGTLVQFGLITKGELTQAKAEKPEPGSGGPRGRKPNLEARAFKNVLKAFKNGEEPNEEDLKLLSPEIVQLLKDKAEGNASRDITTEPGVKIIDDREERIAKKAEKEETYQNALIALQNHKKEMLKINNERKKETDETKKAELLNKLKSMTKELKTLEKKVDELEK